MEEQTNELNKEVQELIKEGDKIIKPFWELMPKKESLNFLKALSQYVEIQIKIEELISTN